MVKKFSCQISSDINSLNILNKDFSWIPGENNIRPSEEILRKKEDYLNNTETFYESEKDFILTEIFGFKDSINSNGKIYVKDDDIKHKNIFCKNMFPYNLSNETNHYVIWYSYNDISEKQINYDITYELQKILGHNKFDFVWYINPKKHMKSIFHAQVFWIIL